MARALFGNQKRGSRSAFTRTPTSRFWDAKEMIDRDAKRLRDLLDGHSRSKMEWFLFLMYAQGFIGDADLDEFSEELRERIRTSLASARR